MKLEKSNRNGLSCEKIIIVNKVLNWFFQNFE